ncbi:hypothetical protein ACQKMD_16685 [Viridibacillus sp. NPDC096237]|uniref:hypothetical protein n=1 Tax=Viridibacillus sp. NPDC096237 TaxID=3390721 RepID=UPI003CFF9719
MDSDSVTQDAIKAGVDAVKTTMRFNGFSTSNRANVVNRLALFLLLKIVGN